MFFFRLPARLSTTLSLKDRRRIRRGLAACALALATMLVVWTLTPRPSGETVLVAAGPISPGTELTAGDLESRSFPTALVPDGALTSPAEAIGKSAAAYLTRGTPVTEAGLVEPREEPLAEGQLLMPVTVTDEAAARTLQPGHRVRIYTAGAAPGESTGDSGSGVPGAAADAGSSAALVEMAVVSSVAREAGNSLGAAATVVTLIVTEDQAAALASVAGSGLHFALLN